MRVFGKDNGPMPKHLMVLGGDLYDTREDPPGLIRTIYKRSVSRIMNAAEFKAALRQGSCTDLGGYPMFFVLSDGEPLCFKCALEHAECVLYEFLDDDNDPGPWAVVGCEINYEDGGLLCVHCGERIPEAYPQDEKEEA